MLTSTDAAVRSASLDPASAPRWAHRLARIAGLIALAFGLAAIVIVSLAVGSRAIGFDVVIDAIFDPLSTGTDQTVVRDLRVPRTLIGLAAGAALGLAGTVIQGVTRNPLADPGLLGVNAGASLFVVVGISALGVSTASGYVWLAFLGAATATVLVYLIGATGRAGATPVRLALAGAALTATIGSITTLLLLTDLAALNQYRFWSVGSLVGRDLGALAQVLPFLLVGAAIALLLGRSLNLFALGDDVARGLGARVGLARAISALAIVLLCGSATAIAGPLVFIGLVAPHLARRFVGTDYRWILPFSAFIGAAALIAADVVGRLIVPPGELEAGILVAALGAPVMIALVRRSRVGAL